MEIMEFNGAYQSREIAEKAFYVRTHVQVLSREIDELLEMVEQSDAPQQITEWLRRVHGNVSKPLKPTMDNLDQVRLILDKQCQGLPK